MPETQSSREAGRPVLAILLAVALALSGCAFGGLFGRTDPLPSWRDGAAKQSIIRFVREVTDASGSGYVGPADRIAVFDNDGTLWAEHPVYVQFAFALDRVRALAPAHPDWKTKQPFRAILEDDREALARLTVQDVLAVVAATHGGLTTEEFAALAGNWLATARHPRFNRLHKELTYQPMLELLDYLRANRFQVYICSGGGVAFVRAFAEEAYGIPPERVIGSESALTFAVRDGRPVLIKQPEIGRINDKDGKPVGIDLHIGKRPILAFGNSDGDLQMLKYTDAGEGRRLMLLLHHDDPVREYAYDRKTHVGRLDKAIGVARTRGWTMVSMKNDFRTVFPFESE